MRLLSRSSLRYLQRHPGQIFLSIIGVAVGVAAITGIDLAIQSAGRGFQISAEQVTGRATHRITGAGNTIPQQTYTALRTRIDVKHSAPVVEGMVAAPGYNRSLRLFGVDPFVEPPFRPYLRGDETLNPQLLKSFMLESNSGILSAQTASEMGLQPGDTLRIRTHGKYKQVRIIGILDPQSQAYSDLLKNMILMDISTAQHLLEMSGRLSRIDLILPEDANGARLMKRIQKILPSSARVEKAGTGTGIMKELVRGFNTNLTAVSFLALIVGLFLIYNTMTFSVLQRRRQLGRLKALGVTPREIFTLILSEALVIGVAGTLIGGAGGIILGRQLLGLVTRTINDLYFTLHVTQFHLPVTTFLKGLGLGIGGTVLTAFFPAREATRSSPRIALMRSGIESRTIRRTPQMAGAGLVLMAGGITLLLVPVDYIYIGYLGMLGVIFGFALVIPILIRILVHFLRPLAGKTMKLLGKISLQSIVTQLSRTAVAIAALTVAISATIAVSSSIDSFRQTVIQWLDTTLRADVYISPQGMISRRNYTPMDNTVLNIVRNTPGVTNITTTKYFRERVSGHQVDIGAVDLGAEGYRRYRFKSGDPDAFWPAFRDSALALISEPYAYHYNVERGDTLFLPTAQGALPFPVAGVYYDYSTDVGTVLLSRGTYERYWSAEGITGIGLDAAEDYSADTLINTLRKRLGEREGLSIRSNQTLHQASMNIFDRTFTITTVLQILTVLVALIGVLSALMALQLERTKEIGVLRALGFTPSQIRTAVILQTGFMGGIAGLLALPLGSGLSLVLLQVINKRSFGWSLQLHLSWESLGVAMLLSIITASIAGIYPAIKMAGQPLARSLREE